MKKKFNIFYTLFLLSLSLYAQNNHRLIHYILDKNTPKIWVDSIGNLFIDDKFVHTNTKTNKVKTNNIIDSKTIFTNHEMYPYLKDKYHVYIIVKERNEYVIEILDSVDLNSFMVKNNTYAKDKNKVYFKGKIIKGANSSNFIILNKYFGKDKINVYYNGEIIKEADANSFELYKLEKLGLPFYGKDKNHIYEGANPVTEEYLKSQGLLEN